MFCVNKSCFGYALMVVLLGHALGEGEREGGRERREGRGRGEGRGLLWCKEGKTKGVLSVHGDDQRAEWERPCTENEVRCVRLQGVQGVCCACVVCVVSFMDWMLWGLVGRRGGEG